MSVQFKPAVRSKVGLLIGMIGGTGSGKTYSALRLATGMAQGQPFALIDTEAGRALHYADAFNFHHADLAPPFRPDNYIEAIRAADKAGYPVIVIDSCSHSWAGEGGVLDWQEEELTRMAGDDWKKREAVKMASWVKPKVAIKRMTQELLQVRAHLILCFRAEEKIEMIKEDGKTKIVPKATLTGINGWVPICEKNLPYELTASFLMLASAPGVPLPIKLQEQHRPYIDLSKPITEETGRRLAEWAEGSAPVDHTEAIRALLTANNVPEAEFLAGAQRSNLSEIRNLAKAKTWIEGNKRAAPQESGPVYDFAQVSAMINAADSDATLDIAADFIQLVDDIDDRNRLGGLVAGKLAEIKESYQ